VFEKQKIVIANDMNYTNENLLITNKEIVRKPFLCTLLKPACLFQGEEIRQDIDELTKLGEDKEQISRIFLIILLLMLPSLLFIYFVYFIVKSAIIVLLLTIIAFMIIKATKHQLTFKKILLIAIFSSTVMILAEPFNLILWNLFYIHIIGFLLLFIVNVSLLSEKRHRY